VSEPAPPKYRAFISYSHADTPWAKWLHRGLESFRVDKDLAGRETATGRIPDSLRPIFRDRDDFTAGHILTEQTQAALDASAALIVICSQASAKSLYVNEEIKLFKSRHPDRPVVPMIVDGKPDDRARECFPPALKVKVDVKGRLSKKRIEVLAADAREEGDGKDLALAKVIAGLLGLSSDDVYRRAERERRGTTRRRRRIQALVGALALLLIAAGLGWWKQDYFKEEYYWHSVMGPAVLTPDQERSMKAREEFRDCASGCPTMVVVPPSKFRMGSSEFGEDPRHEVTIAKPFAVGKYEVTFAEWDVCVASGGCPTPSDSNWGHDKRPAINVSWDDAKQYVAWLSRITGKAYRLLSEAEWEYAADAGAGTLYSFGDDKTLLPEYAWFVENGEGTNWVGEKKPNPFGLYDMHGNVSEWTEDCWHDNYENAPTDGSAWIVGDCNTSNVAVLRGGGWDSEANSLTSRARFGMRADARLNDVGFRVARDLDQ
jgi:formylglycine-generating enzyme required for sulfatase activity